MELDREVRLRADARRLPAGRRLEADVCIVGAGAAGIAARADPTLTIVALAIRLADHLKRELA